MKYNWSIIGHDKQLSILEEDLSSGNLAHAYLLVGPNSVGKHAVAKKLAGILQCENDFCHNCSVCTQILKGSHLDTIELLDDEHSIKIDQIRKIIESVSMTRQSKYKVVLIQAIERMTAEAANSFLKVLEEPPENTVFILTSNTPQRLLPTIVSRVRIMKFHLTPHNLLVSCLSELFTNKSLEEVNKVCLLSMGRAGKAIDLLESPEKLAAYMETYHEITEILDHRNVADRFQYINDLLEEEDGLKLKVFLELLTHVLRSKILEGKGDFEQLAKSVAKISETSMLMKGNVNKKLVLENLMLSI